MQFVSGPAGFEGRALADVQGTRRQGRHFDRFTRGDEFGVHRVWRDHGAARMAGEDGCDQYAAARGVLGGLAGKARTEEEGGQSGDWLIGTRVGLTVAGGRRRWRNKLEEHFGRGMRFWLQDDK